MEPLILQTASEDAGKRLDAWLAEQTELTRSAVQKLMEEGRVTAAGKPLAKNTRLTGGETVSVKLPEPGGGGHRASEYPAGRGVRGRGRHRGEQTEGPGSPPRTGTPGRDTGERPAVSLRGQPFRDQRELRPGIVHRIDRDTSGLIIAAKNDSPM